MKEDIVLYNDSFQNWKSHYVEKAQLILTDIPYQLGIKAYGSNPISDEIAEVLEKAADTATDFDSFKAELMAVAFFSARAKGDSHFEG